MDNMLHPSKNLADKLSIPVDLPPLAAVGGWVSVSIYFSLTVEKYKEFAVGPTGTR